MCRSGTQVELPRRLAMSQVGLVDDHTLHQPCVQSLSFKSTLALWMPAHWTPSLWPTVAIPQRKKWHLPGGRITSGDLPLRTHARTHTHTHTNMLIIIMIYIYIYTHVCIFTYCVGVLQIGKKRLGVMTG